MLCAMLCGVLRAACPHHSTTHTHTRRGVIIPPLPEKNAVQKFQMSSEFVEDRRRALQVRVLRVCACYLVGQLLAL